MSKLPTSIRAARKALEMSQAELAERIGILPAQLCRIETGRTDPSIDLASRIAEALGMTLSELLAQPQAAGSALDMGLTHDASKPVDGKWSECIRVVSSTVEKSVRKAIAAQEARYDELDAQLNLRSSTSIQFSYPFVKDRGAAETLARVMRLSLGAGEVTLADLSGLLDLHGVRIHFTKMRGSESSLAFFDKERGVLSIAVDRDDTPERQTYRLAYELGAACLFASRNHVPIRDEGTDHMLLRDFAAAFLMPEDGVRKVVAQCGLTRKNWTMAALLALKVRFNVSAEAFALRLEKLGLITPSLRMRFRDELRAYYQSHPKSMEPEPHLQPLRESARMVTQDMMKESK